MLEREKCKLVNMNQFGAASHILDRISSARKEKGQLAKKLAALEQKESKAVKRKLALQGEGGNKTAKKADEGHAAEKNDNSIEKYLKPKDTQENNENAIGEETEKQNETAVQEEKEKKDHFCNKRGTGYRNTTEWKWHGNILQVLEIHKFRTFGKQGTVQNFKWPLCFTATRIISSRLHNMQRAEL